MAASLDKEKFRWKVSSAKRFIRDMIFREEHGGEFLKVTHALAERLANAGREDNAEEVQAPLVNLKKRQQISPAIKSSVDISKLRLDLKTCFSFFVSKKSSA